MIKKFVASFTIETSIAVLTWALVSGSSLFFMWRNDNISLTSTLFASVLFAVFIVCWQIAIRDEEFENDVRTRVILMLVQYAAIVLLFFQIHYAYIAILVTLWGSQLPYTISFKWALILSPLWSSPLGLIHTFYWDQSYMLLTSGLFWTFNLFALVMVNATMREKHAREAANELNRDLMATQALLAEATKQAERVRIARNIHDLLGHHLTALTINLQVASRISEGDAKHKIDECHGLAKLLLSDVREAVSDIREKSNLQLQAALTALIENVPEMEVNLDYQEGVNITDVNVANTILCCVQECLTNSLKHSNANQFEIQIKERDNMIHLSMQDNGKSVKDIKEGNGIIGMRERVNELGGRLNFDNMASGFAMIIELPEQAI